MNISRIAHAMEYIDDELITDSISYRRGSKKMFWVKFTAAAAACAVIPLTIAWILPFETVVEYTESVTKPEIKYIEQAMDWMPYNSIESLISDSDTVVAGRITDISFMLHDDMTSPPPKFKYDAVLCTVYGLEISNVYKGDPGSRIKLKLRSIPEDGDYTDELNAVLENVSGTVAVSLRGCPAEPELEVGREYLLVLREFEDFAGYYHPVGYYQGAYQINSDIGEDQRDFSVRNIISYFGEDKWAAFKSENFIEE